jgi:hypothetical protein
MELKIVPQMISNLKQQFIERNPLYSQLLDICEHKCKTLILVRAIDYS